MQKQGTTQLQFQVSSWKYVWCLHVWQKAYSQATFMCDHGVLMPYLYFWMSTSMFSQEVACGFGIRRRSHVVWVYVFVIICVVVDRVESWCLTVPSLCWNVVQSGTPRVFFQCWNEGIFRNTVASPAVWECFRLTEYGCGIRMRPQWGRHALSEAPGRPRQNVDLGLPMVSCRVFGKRIGLCAWFWVFDVANNTTCLARKNCSSYQFSTCLAHSNPHWNMVHLSLWMVKRLSIFVSIANNPYPALLCACSLSRRVPPCAVKNRWVPSDGLRRYGLSIFRR